MGGSRKASGSRKAGLRRALGLAAWAVALASCEPAAENPLAGTWTVVAVRGEAPCVLSQRTTVVFGEAAEGRARWTTPSSPDTVAAPVAEEDCRFDGDVPYRLLAPGADGDPRLAAGPWRAALDRAVEGRVERHGPDRFRFELDAAEEPDAAGATARPATVVFVRKVN